MPFSSAGGGEGRKDSIAQGSMVFITGKYCTIKQEVTSQNYKSDSVKEAKEIVTCELLSSTLSLFCISDIKPQAVEKEHLCSYESHGNTKGITGPRPSNLGI